MNNRLSHYHDPVNKYPRCVETRDFILINSPRSLEVAYH